MDEPDVESLRTPEVRRYWLDFCSRAGVDPDQRWDVFGFGDNAEMADQLGALVLTGPKRATAGLLADFEPHGSDPLPAVGAYSVLIGGHGQPLAVLRTTDVAVKPMSEVDEAFAWDEGEGDRSLEFWMDAHRSFFTRRLAADGVRFDDHMHVVLERFDVVWPQGESST